MPISFKQFLASEAAQATVLEQIKLLEHQVYKLIPGTRNSYRTDAANTNTMTLRHSHVYAKPEGYGKELYSVNITGSGHDGSSGIEIPSEHADYFRAQGYAIPPDNILESLELAMLNTDEWRLELLQDPERLLHG